jgi:hypothetical protein
MTDHAEDLAKLDDLLTAIRVYDDPRRASDEWKQVFRLLQRTDLPKGRVTGVVGMRDVAGLAEIIDRLRSPSACGGEKEVDPDVMKKAFDAFRKRLKLTVLDEESTLGRSPLTKGSGSTVAAIVPPNEWPDEVWQALVREGKLKDIGHGLYGLGKH